MRRRDAPDPLDLRRIRARLTLTYAAAAGVVIVVLAGFAIQQGSQRIRNQLEAEVTARIADVSIDALTGEFEGDDTWLVLPEDDYVEALGEYTVEPPLRTLGFAALEDPGGVAFEEFTQFGTPWLAHGRRITDEEVVVTVAWAGFVAEQTRGLVLSIAALGLAGLAFVTGVSWVVAGRSLRPAREAMARRQDFIADAAHQLRTPLAVIRASASQALDRERDPAAYRESLTEIREASAAASDAVTGLLDLARLEAGATTLHRGDVRLDLLLEEIATVPRDGPAVEVDAPEPVIVSADYTLLRQAVDNVVANAVQRATAVTVSLHADDSRATIHVVDDGPGFPPDQLESVFQRFRRGDRKGSSGLGLAITATVVAAHGGTAEAANRPEGGAVVTLTLPR